MNSNSAWLSHRPSGSSPASCISAAVAPASIGEFWMIGYLLLQGTRTTGVGRQ